MTTKAAVRILIRHAAANIYAKGEYKLSEQERTEVREAIEQLEIDRNLAGTVDG